MRENEAQRLDQGVHFLQTVVGTYDGKIGVSNFFVWEYVGSSLLDML